VSRKKAAKKRRIRRTHLGGSSSSNDVRVLDRPLHNHDRVVQTPLHLRNELIGSTPEDHRACLGLGTILEDVEPLSSDLLLLELPTSSEVLLLDVRARRLNGSSNGLNHSSKIVGSDSTSTEDVPIGEVLGGEISDGEFGKDDFGSGSDDGFELVVDDGPLGVDDGLVFL